MTGRMQRFASATIAAFLAVSLAAGNGDAPRESAKVRRPVPTPPARERAEGTGWNTDLDYGLARAGRAGRPVLVFFSASWAPPCQAMKREVLVGDGARRALRQVEAVEIDVDDQPEVAARFGVDQLPVFAVLDTDGREYDRFGGFLPPGAFVETLEAAVDPKQAPGELERHVARRPKDVQAWWLLARKYARDRKQDKLDEALDAIRRYDSRGREGYLDNAAYLEMMTTLDMEKPNDGYRMAARFLREFADSEFAPEVTVARAQLAWQMGRAQEAVDILENFPNRYPRSALAGQVRADLEAIRGAMRSQGR